MHVKNYLLLTVFTTVLILVACKDSSNEPAPDPCGLKSIGLSFMVDSASKCTNNGSIKAMARGSQGFTFQIDNGAFQTDSIFNNLAAGNHTVTIKDFEGCSKSLSVNVPENANYGPLFSQVKNIITTNCNPACHTAGSQNATKGIFDTDCGIVLRQSSIIQKVVNGSMGNLNSTEKQKFSNWVNAGGLITD